MKKRILTIALAMLIVASVFAAAGETRGTATQTLTQLDVEMKPAYKYNVTSTKFANAAAAEAWDGKSDVSAVEMVRDTSDDKTTEDIKQKDSTTYYVSYMFYEYENVDLKISTSGNLTSTNSTGTKYEIPFKVVVEEVENTFAQADLTPAKATTVEGGVSILSSDSADTTKGTKTILSINKATNILGDYAYGNALLTVDKAEDDSLKGKPDYTYVAYIKLSVVTNG